MSRRGRPPVATPEQVDKVRSLSAQKVSERKIAELVFGDARDRARVERILRRRGSSPTGDPPGEHSAVKPDKGAQAGELELPSVRELLNRHRRRLASGGELPSLKEIELLIKLERQVEAQETLERLTALTREVG